MESADTEERQRGELSMCSRAFHWGVPSNEALLVSIDFLSHLCSFKLRMGEISDYIIYIRVI